MDELKIIKESVRRLTTHLQGIIGYMEIGDSVKAKAAVKDAVAELHQLSRHLMGRALKVPKDSVALVVPEEVAKIIKLPKDSVVITPEGENPLFSSEKLGHAGDKKAEEKGKDNEKK